MSRLGLRCISIASIALATSGFLAITPIDSAPKPSPIARPPRPTDPVELAKWRLGHLAGMFGVTLTNLHWPFTGTKTDTWTINQDGSLTMGFGTERLIFDSDAAGHFLNVYGKPAGYFSVTSDGLTIYRTDGDYPPKEVIDFDPRGAVLWYKNAGDPIGNVNLTPAGLADPALLALDDAVHQLNEQRPEVQAAHRAEEAAKRRMGQSTLSDRQAPGTDRQSGDDQAAMQQRMLMEMQMHQQIQNSIASAIQRGSSAGGVSTPQHSPGLSGGGNQSCGAPGSIQIENGHQCVCKATRADGRNHIGNLNLPDC